MKGELPKNWNEAVAQAMQTAAKQTAPQATRQSSQAMLNAIAPCLPEFVGGSADLTGSNNTLTEGSRKPSRTTMPRATTSITACASSA